MLPIPNTSRNPEHPPSILSRPPASIPHCGKRHLFVGGQRRFSQCHRRKRCHCRHQRFDLGIQQYFAVRSLELFDLASFAAVPVLYHPFVRNANDTGFQVVSDMPQPYLACSETRQKFHNVVLPHEGVVFLNRIAAITAAELAGLPSLDPLGYSPGKPSSALRFRTSRHP